jgi:MSHA pilin protein MshC
MHRAAGFTLTELVIVISLIAITSAVAGGLFLNTDRYATIGAREQLVSTAIVAQKRALANVMTGAPVTLSVTQSASEWLFNISQGATTFDSQRASRAGAQLRINGAVMGDGATVALVFDENAEIGSATQFVFSADNTHGVCLSATGFAYAGNCQP